MAHTALQRRSRWINPTITQKLTNAWHLLDIHYSDTSSEFQKPKCILNQNSYSPSEPLATYCSPPRRWWKRHIRARFRRIKGLGIGDFAFAHAQTGSICPSQHSHTHMHTGRNGILKRADHYTQIHSWGCFLSGEEWTGPARFISKSNVQESGKARLMAQLIVAAGLACVCIVRRASDSTVSDRGSRQNSQRSGRESLRDRWFPTSVLHESLFLTAHTPQENASIILFINHFRTWSTPFFFFHTYKYSMEY